ncbi:MAG: helix-turn-helix domain-containing protein [Ruminococcaceae bacterium]|nr:helix-turn-helix domain-containing protein [Oscillospiraceae bacterium]
MPSNELFERDLWVLPNINFDSVKNFPLHYHRHLEFLYITEGEFHMDIGGKRYRISRGDTVLITPYILHSYIKNTDCSRCIIVSEPECIGYMGDFFLKNHPICPVMPSGSVKTIVPDIEEKMRDIYNLCHTIPYHEPIKQMRIIALIQDTFSRLCASYVFEDSKKYVNNIYISALKLCCDNFSDEEFGLDMISRALNVSTSTVQKLFAKNMHMGVKEYINYLRAGNARSLIVSTNRSISSIALSCGFGTIRSFNRTFLKFYGVTPGELRRLGKNSE